MTCLTIHVSHRGYGEQADPDFQPFQVASETVFFRAFHGKPALPEVHLVYLIGLVFYSVTIIFFPSSRKRTPPASSILSTAESRVLREIRPTNS